MLILQLSLGCVIAQVVFYSQDWGGFRGVCANLAQADLSKEDIVLKGCRVVGCSGGTGTLVWGGEDPLAQSYAACDAALEECNVQRREGNEHAEALAKKTKESKAAASQEDELKKLTA